MVDQSVIKTWRTIHLVRSCFVAGFFLTVSTCFAEEEKRIALEKLDGPTRAKVLAALAGMIILWFAVIALIWLGARVTRRYMRSRFDKDALDGPSRTNFDDWAKKPLVAADGKVESELDDESST